MPGCAQGFHEAYKMASGGYICLKCSKPLDLHDDGLVGPRVHLDAYGNPPGETMFGANVIDVFTEARDVLLKKHRDYGPANIAGAPGGPLNGLRVRIYDKVARINHLIDQGAEPENESLRDSFLDLANYALIAMLVLDGRWPEK